MSLGGSNWLQNCCSWNCRHQETFKMCVCKWWIRGTIGVGWTWCGHCYWWNVWDPNLPSHEEIENSNNKSSSKEDPAKVSIPALDPELSEENEVDENDKNGFFYKKSEVENTETDKTFLHQTNLNYGGERKAFNKDPTDDLEPKRETLPIESLDNVHEA